MASVSANCERKSKLKTLEAERHAAKETGERDGRGKNVWFPLEEERRLLKSKIKNGKTADCVFI